MRLSKRGEYGLRALQDLAVHYGEGPVRNKDLARRNNIPPRFLEQILLTLKHGRIVHSRKGPQGGYYLARPPQQINLAEVVRLLGGPPSSTRWYRQTGWPSSQKRLITCQQGQRCR